MNTLPPTVFLWGQRFPEPPTGGDVADGEWWRQYSERLKVSAAALAELSESSRRVMSVLPRVGSPEEYPSPVRGVVVGSVQSGKTAHMLALTARALDMGYKCVVVLAGLRDDLRAQTARRFNVQLLRQRDPLAEGRAGFTMSSEAAIKRVEAMAPPYFTDCHQWPLFHVRMMRAIARGIPIVAVVKKNRASLSTMRERIRQVWAQVSAPRVPLLVLDDECDEASVEPEDETPTPELIANLWRSVGQEPSGAIAYVGYTATVAANLLQKPDNALYPSDFVYLLRAPASTESAVTFAEPSPHKWYCGGETFYERFIRPTEGGSSLLVEPCVTEDELRQDPRYNESLKQAIRVFLSGAALRHLEQPQWSFEAVDGRPAPHTMIVQASTVIADHDKWASAVRSFLGIDDAEGGASPVAVDTDIEQHPERWKEAIASLEQSRGAVSESQPHPWPLCPFEWGVVSSKIRSLLSWVRLRVLNSAPGSVDALDFAGATGPNGELIPARDPLSIIVGGGRLSRGLTIDGLSVSYFVRQADVPTEDTILQLSRWYGYRGSHLDYCRVFTTEAIASELSWISLHDHELRTRLAALMRDRTTPRDAGLVLSSIPHGLPTGKLGVGKVRDICYSPWCRALTFVEIGSEEEHNESIALELVKSILKRDGEDVRTGAGSVRGKVSRGWSVIETIEVLESLKYTTHNPDEAKAVLGASYRAHDRDRSVSLCLPEELDPYAIAAYLRLWAAKATSNGSTLPVFNVGVAYGSETDDIEPFRIPLADREVASNGFVNGGWIGRSEGWRGDQFFDGVCPTQLVDDTAKRREGAPGLLLLYVIHKDSRGRRGRGEKRSHHSPMLGISIPAGGPPVRRVLLEGSQGVV